MRCNSWVAIILVTTLGLLLSGSCFLSHTLYAADANESEVATRPWASLWVSSIGRALAACDLIFESVDRPDLAESLEDRLADTA